MKIEDAIKRYESWAEDDRIDVLIRKEHRQMADWLKELKADRPSGEWILLEPRYPIEQKVYWNKEQALADTKGNGAIERRKCSYCGYTKSFMCHMKDEQIKLWKFCPNCGCQMKGADDETR